MEASFANMLVTLRARVQQLIDEGKSEDEAVAAKPTKDFDAPVRASGQFPHRGRDDAARVSISQGWLSRARYGKANTNTAGSVFSGTNSGANRRPLLYTPDEPVDTATYCLPSTA